MKELIAKEFLYSFVALIVSAPVGFLYLYSMNLQPAGFGLTPDEMVFEMDLFIVGSTLGFIGVYIIRLTVWAVKKNLLDDFS